MKSYERTTALLALLMLSGAVPPRPAAAALLRPIRFERLSLDEGLSQAAVMDVLQDRRGYVWMATEDGLNRYDGSAFKVYRHDAADAASLPDGFVWDVEEDGAGSLWIATRGGLGRWDRADRTASSGRRRRRTRTSGCCATTPGPTPSGSAPATPDSSGSTWRKRARDRFAHDNDRDARSLVDDRIFALYVDAKDRLWVGTEGGLDLLDADGKTFTHHVPRDSDPFEPRDVRIRHLSPTTRAACGSGPPPAG